jgi:hypothetical protein
MENPHPLRIYTSSLTSPFTPLSLVALLLLGTTLPLVSWAEPGQQPQIPSLTEKPPEDEARAKLERDMAKKANQERQAQLKRDTEKLLKLATELKEYVDKSNENVLSLDVVKKAEEIEKLAHGVREKMKNAGSPYESTPSCLLRELRRSSPRTLRFKMF